jgi:opacity protein-like surface antigen
MKAALAILLLAVSLSASAQTADAIYKQACGPLGAKFVVEQVPGKPPAAPELGKALVFFIQKESGAYFTTRVGLDGAWVGVLQDDSYIFASVAPGEHHTCAATLNRKRPEVELLNFTVEAGRTYYYLVRGTAATSDFGGFASIVFGAADRDEARYLIASDPQSKATPAR